MLLSYLSQIIPVLSPVFFYIKLSQASVLLPVATGIAAYKKLPLPFKVLFYFFVASIGFEAQASILKRVYHNNMPGLHLFTLVEFLVFTTVFYHHFRKNSPLRLFTGINTIIFLVVWPADAFFINGLWHSNSLSRSYSSVSMIGYTLVYFFFLFRKDMPEYRSDHPMFWISTGALLYFGANTFYFMLANYFIIDTAPAEYSVAFHAVINIISNLLYAQSFRCFRKQEMAL